MRHADGTPIKLEALAQAVRNSAVSPASVLPSPERADPGTLGNRNKRRTSIRIETEGQRQRRQQRLFEEAKEVKEEARAEEEAEAKQATRTGHEELMKGEWEKEAMLTRKHPLLLASTTAPSPASALSTSSNIDDLANFAELDKTIPLGLGTNDAEVIPPPMTRIQEGVGLPHFVHSYYGLHLNTFLIGCPI